jgi:glycosyltransferase involved in cell wall biosynthesis
LKVLIIHNQLWSHYKAKLFSELYRLKPDDMQLKVFQIGLYEKSRANLGEMDSSVHQYDYDLLFERSLEDIGLVERSLGLLAKTIDYQPNIVNLTGYYDPATWLVWLYCRVRGINIVMSNESTTQDQTRIGWKEWVKYQLISACDAFFCFGTKAAEYMLALGAKPDSLWVKNAAIIDNEQIKETYRQSLPNTQNTKVLLNLPAKNFIFVGRLVTVKNLPLLLKAFKQVVTPDWGLILLGNGEEKSKLQQQLEENNIPNVTFIEGQTWHQVPAYLALADVLVLPSYSETWGLVVNEAMVCGLPVIVSDQCGCAVDLVENKGTGIVFQSDNLASLVEAMKAFIDKKVDATQMGKTSQQVVEHFSPNAAATEMIAVFEKLNNL